MVSYIARSSQSTISNLTKNTPTYDAKFVALPVTVIDFNSGTGAAMIRQIGRASNHSDAE